MGVYSGLSKLWSLLPRIRPRIIIGTQKGTIILTIPHIGMMEKKMETTMWGLGLRDV